MGDERSDPRSAEQNETGSEQTLGDEASLTDFLRLRGHNDDEVQKILAKLAERDSLTARESVFDSIEAGTFNLDAIIREALQQ